MGAELAHQEDTTTVPFKLEERNPANIATFYASGGDLVETRDTILSENVGRWKRVTYGPADELAKIRDTIVSENVGLWRLIPSGSTDEFTESRYRPERRTIVTTLDKGPLVIPHAPTDPTGKRLSVEPDRQTKVAAELLSYVHLPMGWDGYYGVPASFDAVFDAINFLSRRPADIRAPYPQLAHDGEVGLYWRTSDVYAEVGFEGDHTFSYYARHNRERGEQTESWRDGCKIDDGWPAALLLIVGKIAC